MFALLLALTPQAEPAQEPVQESVLDRLTIYANGRLRWESTFDQPGGDERHRGRLRLRIGAGYAITDGLRADARLTTVSDGRDANNPYWDFGGGDDGFEAAEIGIDRFFLTWEPASSLDVRAGKLPHAFASPPIYGEFVWDADVQPAGGAVVWTPQTEGDVSGDVRLVGYVAVENGGDDDSTMFGAQGNLDLALGERTDAHLATGYMLWGNLDDGAGSLDNQGNTDPTGDFEIWESWASVTVAGAPWRKTTAFGQYMNNVADDDDEEQGFAVGLRAGTAGSQGDWNAFGVYYDLDANAVFSPVAQDDTPIAGTGIGTGMDGFVFGAQYFWRDNVSFRLWALTSDADASDDPFRIRLDLDFKVP